MKTKRSRPPGKRPARRGRKPGKSTTAEARFNAGAIEKSLTDDHWRLNVTLVSDDRVQLVSMIIIPKPPQPPVRPFKIQRLIANAVLSVPGPAWTIG